MSCIHYFKQLFTHFLTQQWVVWPTFWQIIIYKCVILSVFVIKIWSWRRRSRAGNYLLLAMSRKLSIPYVVALCFLHVQYFPGLCVLSLICCCIRLDRLQFALMPEPYFKSAVQRQPVSQWKNYLFFKSHGPHTLQHKPLTICLQV